MKKLSNFIYFTVVLTPVQLRCRFCKMINLNLLSLLLKIVFFIFEVERRLLQLCIIDFIDFTAITLIIFKIKIIVQQLIALSFSLLVQGRKKFILIFLWFLICAFWYFLQRRIGESAKINWIRSFILSISCFDFVGLYDS